METKDIIRNRRIELDLTMKDVAEKVGVSEGTISRWESGNISNMRRDKIVLLAKALNIKPSVIMGWEESSTAPSDGQSEWYIDPTTAKMAQEVFADPDTRMLFDAARDAKPEDIRLAAEMLKRMKETNRDG